VKPRHRGPKATLMNLILRWQSEKIAEQIAVAIEASACGPGEVCTDPTCPDHIRHEQAHSDAATARRIGGSL
jgi:hypothetical protein